MSAAAVEHPHDGKSALLREAERLAEKLPGYRIEIIGGELTVTPPADGPHADSLTDLTFAFAPAHGAETRVAQAMGVWLPDGPEDYAVPDLAVVDADYRDHLLSDNCYDPAVFRMVLEVTSSNYATDLKKKVAAYAIAKIPVYVVIDRKKDRVHVLTDPFANEYRCHRVHAPGQQLTLPESLGAEITLDVAAILDVARP
ncbi:Uma2 family endonuclease [Streptomyces angustmyceticus]|uniref:Membrane protein n=1 Tax=Streptomyces angustmyceticus TaxID=285578 RepID=A0A5J4LFU9_9ACTN|nr:Uma2 family endonuclease [Streptomyces angustmyceticus]UAL67345.1 Uma2 family endonuclease [Streptomyces angustmyceticus]GES30326.1 membrane protein [Streptomyces angustmyceticus]